jgi:hypothetical protein
MRNIALSISSELNKQFIINPIREGLRGLLPGGKKPGEQQPELLNVNADEFTDLIEKARDGFSNLTQSISQGLAQMFQQSQGGFTEFFSSLSSLVSSGIQGLSSGLGGLFGGSGDSGMMSGIGSAVSTAVSFIGSLFAEKGGLVPGGLERKVKHFAIGGFVDKFPPITAESMGIKMMPELRFGAGGEVPAILHAGEFVLRKSAVDKIGIPKLTLLNEGVEFPRISSSVFDVPRAHFANGGAVAAASNVSGMGSKMGGGTKVLQPVVNVHGDVSPQRGFTEANCIEVVLRDANNDGPIAQTLRSRMHPKL